MIIILSETQDLRGVCASLHGSSAGLGARGGMLSASQMCKPYALNGIFKNGGKNRPTHERDCAAQQRLTLHSLH